MTTVGRKGLQGEADVSQMDNAQPSPLVSCCGILRIFSLESSNASMGAFFPGLRPEAHSRTSTLATQIADWKGICNFTQTGPCGRVLAKAQHVSYPSPEYPPRDQRGACRKPHKQEGMCPLTSSFFWLPREKTNMRLRPTTNSDGA
jgi:hypothetical protein